MEEIIEESSMERQMVQRARERKYPIKGGLELLPLCNMNCDMCYVRLSPEEMASNCDSCGNPGRLRTVDEWISIARQMAENGTLFLLVTGGEVLLYPGFKELFVELKKMGFIMSVNTNGTLIDEEWADFFARYKPRRLSITLYGSSDEDYERLCHYPGGYTKVTRGIKLLRERGVDVKISMSLMPANIDALDKVHDFGDALGIPVRLDAYMMPSEREKSKPFDLQNRLSPERAAEAALKALKRELPEGFYPQYIAQTIEKVENFVPEDMDRSVPCYAGSCAYTINWQGNMRPCEILHTPSVNVFEHGFEKSWQMIRDAISKVKISEKCVSCRYKICCRSCAAAGLLETGSYEGTPDYLCRYAEHYYSLVKAEAVR